MKLPRTALLCAALALAGQAAAEEVSVAVASNFAAPLQKLAVAFEKKTGHKLIVSSGATGKLFAQIKNGAPFQVLLAADDVTPARLEAEGFAVKGSQFTYAVGRLALWSTDAKLIDGRPEVLKTGNFKHIAIANPQLAPYGLAAMQTLAKLDLEQALQSRIVRGENIGQTHQFVASGNAELGFVALSQVMVDGQMGAGSFWLVPPIMHTAIRQDALLLVKGKDSKGAKDLMQYLQSPATRQFLSSNGYGH